MSVKNEKNISLSAKSLKKVWQWCENNRGDPLAEAYESACILIGSIDCSAISDRLCKSWRGKKYGYIAMAYSLDDHAFIARDNIGRAILGVIKREERDE